MRLSIVANALLLLVIGPAVAQETTSESRTSNKFYPEIEPFKTGYLRVSDLHEIYYELCGTPAGRPVMVLHGGPGGGSYPTLRRYHDPKKYLIVLHDQRGAGRSKPYAELPENTTQDLVNDIEKLRKHLDLGKVQIFGGSWGSTLGLAYAEQYPDNVSSLVLRGIFTATRWEIDHFYHGPVAEYFPEVHERLKSILPHADRLDYPRQLLDMLRSKDPKVRDKAARAWAAYEIKIADIEKSDEDVQRSLDSWGKYYDFALIENHYMANSCFLDEGQLLREAGRLKDIPTVIVHGRYDMICPPVNAWRLHEAVPGSRLVLVEAAGHSGGSPRMRAALIEAVKSLETGIMKKGR
ncbi:MAG: prolyl aminopeptidase [Phycisphaerae bacterium]|nr:prolyl aminopeptidase [Phycisphaerae bacterium]